MQNFYFLTFLKINTCHNKGRMASCRYINCAPEHIPKLSIYYWKAKIEIYKSSLPPLKIIANASIFNTKMLWKNQ